MKGTVVCAIVQRGKAEEMFARAREAGSGGGTIFYALGTASSALLTILGIGDRRKEMVITLTSDERRDRVFDAMVTVPRGKGVVFSVECGKSCVRRERSEREECHMESQWEVINVICNQGYGEEVMAAARGAGAGGGTLMSGRGTGTPDDVKFFGIPLVPEKELLMILLERERVDAVYDAIVSLPLLQEAGSGIVYTMPVSRFEVMGK